LLADTAIRAAEDYLVLLDADGVLRWAEEAVAASNRSGLLRHQIQSTLLHVWLYILRGNTQQALLTLETAQRMAKTAGVEFTQMPRPPVRLATIIVPFFAGDWDKCEIELLKWQDWPSDVVLVQTAWISGWLCLEQGDLSGAKTKLREAVNMCETRGEKTLAVAPLSLLSQAASKSGELDEAAAHLRLSQEITSQADDWRGLMGEVHLAEGILSIAERRWEEAKRAFQKAVEIHRRYRLSYYEARALFEWARMYILRNGRGDRKLATELLDCSLNLFEKINAKKMVEKVQAHKRS
jgi:tetratricopeptide (TPR) repeat protein